MYRLRLTALETPSLKRNQTSLLPTALPMHHSAASVSGAESPVGTTVSCCANPGLPPSPADPTHTCACGDGCFPLDHPAEEIFLWLWGGQHIRQCLETPSQYFL